MVITSTASWVRASASRSHVKPITLSTSSTRVNWLCFSLSVEHVPWPAIMTDAAKKRQSMNLLSISTGFRQAIITDIINSTIDFKVKNTGKLMVALEGVEVYYASCGFSEAPDSSPLS